MSESSPIINIPPAPVSQETVSPINAEAKPTALQRVKAVLSTLNRYEGHYINPIPGLDPFGYYQELADTELPDTRGWLSKNFIPRQVDLAVKAWKSGKIQSVLRNPPQEEDLGPDPRPLLRQLVRAREADTEWFAKHTTPTTSKEEETK